MRSSVSAILLLNFEERPITSYGALDLPSYFLDVTPFVPLLTDGKPHNFSLDVVSAETDHVINQNWFVSGLLQVVTDPSGKPTTGKMNIYDASPFAVTSTTGSVADNGDVIVTVSATRDIHIESTIVSGSGKTTKAVFSQHLTYSNTQSFLNETFIQVSFACFIALRSLDNFLGRTSNKLPLDLCYQLTTA